MKIGCYFYIVRSNGVEWRYAMRKCGCVSVHSCLRTTVLTSRNATRNKRLDLEVPIFEHVRKSTNSSANFNEIVDALDFHYQDQRVE